METISSTGPGDSVDLNPFSSLLKHRQLISQLIWRELGQRYQGAFLGSLWSLLVPLLMLGIYTYVFSTIFKAQWGSDSSTLSPGVFGLTLFAGLAPYNLFVEVLNRAPSAVLSVPNYVKKVVFPLEILPVVVVGAAVVNSLISVGLLLIGSLVLLGTLPPTIILLPLAYLPLILMALAAGWFLSSMGVFVRDIGQAIGVIVQILFFLSPVFYSETSAPEPFRQLLVLNPLTTILMSFRRVLLWNELLPWNAWLTWTLLMALLAWLSYIWFIKTKRGFADVL